MTAGMNSESKGYVTCTGESAFRVSYKVFKHFLCLLVCACIHVCLCVSFNIGQIAHISVFKLIFILKVLVAPCHLSFFSCMQFEKAPSVTVIICVLRGTHTLTVTQSYYS